MANGKPYLFCFIEDMKQNKKEKKDGGKCIIKEERWSRDPAQPSLGSEFATDYRCLSKNYTKITNF